DGRRLVTQGGPETTGAFPTKAVVWDTATWTPVGDPWTLDETYVDDGIIAVSPDGERVAMPSSDGKVRVWRVADRGEVGEPLAVDVGRVTTLGFAPDGRLAVAG